MDRQWFEMKTLEKYSGGMAPHKFSFALESLHFLDCFWACEDGLRRRHPKSQIASFVFQELHYPRDNVVSTIITIAIRRHLSKDVPKTENCAFSSKSLCVASITQMATPQGVNFFESRSLSCDSICTNQEM